MTIPTDHDLVMIMPVGKHKGEYLDNLPSDYLLWVAENFSQEKIAQAADRIWQWREKNNQHEGG